MNFSQRLGLEPAVKPLQTDSMDWRLRNALWNVIHEYFVAVEHSTNEGYIAYLEFLEELWTSFFGQRITTKPRETAKMWSALEGRLVDDSKVPWNKVYELVEFLAKSKYGMRYANWFCATANVALERENSGFRFVGRTLAPITNEGEIKAIEAAANHKGNILSPVSAHIQAATKLFADRDAPDFRNSMKESISAVEAICKIIAQNDKATLGPALDTVTARVHLHARLQQGFKELYGYSNDTHGIRHALKDDAEPESEDAKFFLVACSGFVNYLIEKARKNGLLT